MAEYNWKVRYDDPNKKEDDDQNKGGSGGNPDDKTYTEGYVKTLRDENAKWRTKLRETEERLAKFDGIDPEAIKTLLQEKEDAEKKKLEEKGEWDKLKEQMVQAHKDDAAKLQGAIDGLKAQLAGEADSHKKTILKYAVTQEAALAKAINPRVVELILSQEAVVEFPEGGGDAMVKFKKADGTVRLNLKTGEPMSVKERLEEMKQSEEYAMLFEGARQGGGSRTTGSGKGTVNPWAKDTLNLTEQGRIVKENPALAKQLAGEAGVTLSF